MRTRVDETRCGRCGGRYKAGTPMLVLEAVGWRRPLRRCPTCAGEPVPADVAALPEELPRGERPQMRAVRTAALDDKQRQLGGDQ